MKFQRTPIGNTILMKENEVGYVIPNFKTYYNAVTKCMTILYINV